MSDELKLNKLANNVGTDKEREERRAKAARLWPDHENVAVRELTAASIVTLIKGSRSKRNPFTGLRTLQDEEVVDSLAEWINCADWKDGVDKSDAWRAWKKIVETKNVSRYIGPATSGEVEITRKKTGEVTEVYGLVVSYAAAAAWAYWLVDNYEDVSPETFAKVLSRQTLISRTRLERLGIPKDEIEERFPTLDSQAAIRREKKDEADRLKGIPGRRRRGRGRSSAGASEAKTQAAGGFNAKALVTALKENGVDAEAREAIWMAEPKDVKSLVAAMKDAGVDADTREAVWMALG
jgi:hypothetical protein